MRFKSLAVGIVGLAVVAGGIYVKVDHDRFYARNPPVVVDSTRIEYIRETYSYIPEVTPPLYPPDEYLVKVEGVRGDIEFSDRVNRAKIEPIFKTQPPYGMSDVFVRVEFQAPYPHIPFGPPQINKGLRIDVYPLEQNVLK